MLWVWGWHVLESITKNRSRKIFKIQLLMQNKEKVENLLRNSQNFQKTQIEIVDNNFLNKKYGSQHQGIAMQVSQINFFSLKDWTNKQERKSFLIACDLLNDPHNLGAIIRTCKALGANGILVTNNKSAPFNGALVKATAGALESFDVIMVTNLATSLMFLKKEGFIIYGLDHRGESHWEKADRSVVVVGQEGAGLRDLTKKRCDYTIRIRTKEDFSVLNVSVASGIIVSKFLGG
ncbi:23S rRNA (guanosine(2251)-2'-O)-methyltransferase RlmB [Alphaproteobacteria bacterium endosymbiont of Tiliacea citrago]|uniref:23S rRNA (guanosine(2251)-2'-O)-methyltransferase RlmB n=1 Tax=Alphaproteobacteria bacterium endosymbiont of Tiliacea citrago TaxID=3077944 RepID=UPI00313B3D53